VAPRQLDHLRLRTGAPSGRKVSHVAGRTRRWTWTVELLVYLVLMVVFGALLPDLADDPRHAMPPAHQAAFFGALAAFLIGDIVVARFRRRRGQRAREPALAALEALDLSSEESRRAFVEAAKVYSTSYEDTVGDRISRLAEALQWSSPDRRDFSTLEPLLEEARRCTAIERWAKTRLARMVDRAPGRRVNLLTGEEQWTLILGLLFMPALVFAAAPREGLLDPISRSMVLFVALLAWMVLSVRISWRSHGRAAAAMAAALARRGLDADPLTVEVVLDVIGSASRSEGQTEKKAPPSGP